MSALSTVISLLDYLPVFLAVTGLLAFLGLVQRGIGSENRSTYFPIWMPAILITAGITTASSFWVWRLHVQSGETQRKRTANSQMRAINAAAFAHFMDSDGWPLGDNREIVEKLSETREDRGAFLDRSKLTLASDGSAVDPWGRPYFFVITPGSGLTVHSMGADGIKGTKDDLP